MVVCWCGFACIVGCVWSWCLADRFAGAVSCSGLWVGGLRAFWYVLDLWFVCTGFVSLLSSYVFGV